MKRKIVQYYGLEHHKLSDVEDPSPEEFRIAFCNLSMSIKDGNPIQIPNLNYLFVGSIGSAYNLDKLLHNKITHILCLSGTIRLNFPYHFIYHRIPMADIPEYDIISDLQQIYEFINSAKTFMTEDGNFGKVLIHCYQGKSRSVAVCCAYLIQHCNFSLDAALETIRQVRPIAAPNCGFMAALRRIEYDRLGVLNTITTSK